MMRRTIILLLIGVLIIGGSIGLRTIQIDCNSCNGDGKIECLICEGQGAILLPPVWIECGCRSKNPDCLICKGAGGYFRLRIGVCPTCEGKGGKICPKCNGEGKMTISQRFLGLK